MRSDNEEVPQDASPQAYGFSVSPPAEDVVPLDDMDDGDEEGKDDGDADDAGEY